jgi:hypothetical protein
VDLGRDGLDPGHAVDGSPRPVRREHGTTGNAVLFGGQDALGRFLSDTWLFNRRTTCTKFGACLFGFVWTQATYPTGAAEPPPLNDTCVYNFDLPQWFGPNLPQTTRAARFGHGLAHYPVSGLRVLYGGQASTRRPGPRSCRRIPGMRHVTRRPTRGAVPAASSILRTTPVHDPCTG